jgi:hypothetical protein
VAEQLGFDQFVRQRGAVDVAEPALPPRAEMMNRAGDQLLSRAALSFNQPLVGNSSLTFPKKDVNPAAGGGRDDAEATSADATHADLERLRAVRGPRAPDRVEHP